MKRSQFNKTHLATCLSVALGASMIGQVHAQDANASAEADVEVIKVSGIRGSLIESTATKRMSRGVVDAISSEDIGKFPDTNLAESLQRITGISIDRSNGEGSKVTIRGFRADYNMVTLNGRAMPSASLGGTGLPTSRAFDFADLASESVRAVEVYKTGKANIASGGLGGTINIITAKPLDNPGQHATVGVKAISDTTNRAGSDITPEISGMFSFTNEDETFGASITASQQTRHSGSSGAFVSSWGVEESYDGTIEGVDAANIDLTNAPAMGQSYSIPSDIRYFQADRERVRTNAQVTLQYRPSDKLEATLDYTMSSQELTDKEAEQSSWYAFTPEKIIFDDSPIKTPLYYGESAGGSVRDQAFAQNLTEQLNENDSIGFNLKYDVNEDLTLVLDAHSSSAKGSPNAPFGLKVQQGIAGNIDGGHAVDFSGEFPIMMVEYNDSIKEGLNNNNQLDLGDIGTTVYTSNMAQQETDVNQFRLDGTYLLDNGQIDFGVESRSMETTSQSGQFRSDQTGGWGVNDPGTIPAGLIDQVDFADLLDFDTNGAFTDGFIGDADKIGAWALNYYDIDAVIPVENNQTIKEEITAIYAQLTWEGEIADMPYNLVVGVRNEETSLTSTVQGLVPSKITWKGNNDFEVEPGVTKQAIQESNDYSNFLPNLDFDVNFTDDLVGRFSVSKTMARASLGELAANKSVTGAQGTPTVLSTLLPAGGSAGNPQLAPTESTNLDLSLEWYYDEASYVSVGYYKKDAKNFIGTEQVDENLFGLRDVTNGQRAQDALAALETAGEALTDTNLFNMVVAMENGLDYSTLNEADTELNYDVMPDANDPLQTFRVQKPLNTKDFSVDGMEFAVQHFFSDSGFGVQANYTTVDGDISYDVSQGPNSPQFAILGLSDTANLVGLYDKDGLQVRVAYNWRGEFLEAAGADPRFVEEFTQIDVGASYTVSDNLTIHLDAINLTDENRRAHQRNVTELVRIEQYGARYAFGARYTF
jgi:TonB-dependent receptor